MDFIKNTVDNKMKKDAQPGNSFEGAADNAANQGMNNPSISKYPLSPNNEPIHWIPSGEFVSGIANTWGIYIEVDQLAGDAGVPQQADNTINEFVDDKVNQEIPGGNN